MNVNGVEKVNLDDPWALDRAADDGWPAEKEETDERPRDPESR